MKKNDLYNALSGINKDYIAESEKFEAIAADVRMKRNRKLRIIASALCLGVFCIGAIGIGKNGLLKSNIQSSVKNNRLISQIETTTEISTKTADSVQLTSEYSSFNGSETELLYSELVKNTEIPELNGYENAAASLDISSFDESLLLKETDGVIEGEIVDIWVNTYEYTTAFDKFEPNGQLHHKNTTVAYKIRVDKVLSGEFSVGDVITVEDVYFMLDSIISIKKGSSYVIPIYNWEGILYENDEILSGSNILESCYATYYQFHPQIEKVDGGYVVPDDWKTLITDECSEIIMDIDDAENKYYGSMYFVPDSIFNDRMNLILK